jgi:glycerophosphoryl diester phosphodiesterase
MPDMPVVVAHRGASKTCRENTIDAFVEAQRQGAAMVELDVRRSADDVLVVHHDAVVAGIGPIIGVAKADLPEYVPTLAEALDACAGMQVNIEVKNDRSEPDFDPQDRVARAVVDLLGLRGDGDDMLISSFRFETINAIRSLDDRLRTGFLFTRAPLSPLRLKALLHRTASAGHVAVHPHHRGVSTRMCEIAHDVGLEVNTWTVDDPNRMRTLARHGVDAVITNVPSVAVDAFRNESRRRR